MRSVAFSPQEIRRDIYPD